MKERLIKMNEKGDICAAAMLATVRIVLIGKGESVNGAQGVEEGKGKEVGEEEEEEDEINVEVYGREKTKELLEDRMELEERAIQIKEMENMEHDENGRSHVGLLSVDMNVDMNVGEEKCENMLFLKVSFFCLLFFYISQHFYY